MKPSTEQLIERATRRADRISNDRLREIISADDEYYRPMFDSETASRMATEILARRTDEQSKDGGK